MEIWNLRQDDYAAECEVKIKALMQEKNVSPALLAELVELEEGEIHRMLDSDHQLHPLRYTKAVDLLTRYNPETGYIESDTSK